MEAARNLGSTIAQLGLRLVYGGGRVGLMGALADTVLARGGQVTGVIPRFLMDREVGHRGLTHLEVVDSMHQRKARMADRSDAFVALPGGLGTLEELCEVWTWAQLNLHTKPIGVLNSAGYFDRLIQFLDQAVNDGFIAARTRGLIVEERDPAKLIDCLLAQRPDAPNGWDRRV